jgi:hypothetical protein
MKWAGQIKCYVVLSIIVAVPDTKTGIKRTVTVTNPEFVRLYRKYVLIQS